MAPPKPLFRIFISSPGDVSQERVLALKTVERLAEEFAGYLTIEPLFWEHEPLPATETFQARILPSAECQVFVCILWKRLGSPLPARFCRADGSLFDSGTEYEYELAIEGNTLHPGLPHMLVYLKTAPGKVPSEEEAAKKYFAQEKKLAAFKNKWLTDGRDGSPKACFAFDTATEFENLLREHLDKHVRSQIPALIGGQGLIRRRWKDGSPFRGLQVFDFEHAGIFCGRSQAVGEVTAALQKQAELGRAFVLVLGASGAGKSSLVRAGVLPRLCQPGFIRGVKGWLRAICTPGAKGGDPFAALASALVEGTALPHLLGAGISSEELAGLLRRDPAAALTLIKSGLIQAPVIEQGENGPAKHSETRLALVVDQMEEIFLGAEAGSSGPEAQKAAEERRAFIAAISCLARSGRVWVLATLRSDFYHRCAELPELVDLKCDSGQYDLLLPTATELGEMIKQPAHAAGAWFEEDPESKRRLHDELRDAASANPEILPLLEFALQQLYEKRSPTEMLTWEAYRAMGQLVGALAAHAEQTFLKLDPADQALLPGIFRRLVAPGHGEGASGRKTVVRKHAPMSLWRDSPGCQRCLRAFVQARLLTTGGNQGATVLVAHEALLRHWPTLVKWLEEDAEMRDVRARVEARVEQWLDNQREPTLLSTEGTALEEVRRLAHSMPEDLQEETLDFLRASQRRAAWKRGVNRLAVGTLVVLTAAATAAAFYASSQRDTAQKSELRAAASAIDAKRKLAEGQVADGDARTLLGRSGEAREDFVAAHAIFQELGVSSLRADLGLWKLFQASPPELLTYRGHTGPVIAVAFRPDGRTALSTGADRTLKLWDVYTGRQIISFPASGEAGHSLPVTRAALSRDGRFALSGGNDNTLKLWDVDKGTLMRSFVGHVGAITCVAFSPDGLTALSGSVDTTLKWWDLESANVIETFPSDDAVNCIAFSPDGRAALSGSADHTLTLWDLKTRKRVRQFPGHAFPVTAVAFAPDGQSAFSIAEDHTLKKWDLVTGNETPVPEADRAGEGNFAPAGVSRATVTAAAFSGDASTALSGGSDGSLVLWDLTRANPVGRFSGYTRAVASVALSPVGRLALVGSADDTLALWDLRGDQEIRTFSRHTYGVTSVVFCPDGLTALSGSQDHDVIQWDVATGKPLRTLSGHKKAVTSVAISPDGRFALSGSWDNDAILWDLSTGTLVRRLSGHADMVSSVAFLPDGLRAVSGSEDRTLKVWDLKTGQPTMALPGHASSGVTCVAVAADGRTMVSGSSDRFLKLWDLVTGKELRNFGDYSSSVLCAALLPDGRSVLAGSEDGSIKRWDLSSGALRQTLPGHARGVTGVIISPDGRTAFSSSSDDTIKVWDLQSGTELRSFGGHSGAVSGIALSPDGRRVLSCSWDKTLKLWDFSRIDGYISFRGTLPTALERLAQPTADADASALLGRWFLFRGADACAVDLLEKARRGGTDVSALQLARCYWNLHRPKEARREFLTAATRKEAPQGYLDLCLQAVDQSGATAERVLAPRGP